MMSEKIQKHKDDPQAYWWLDTMINADNAGRFTIEWSEDGVCSLTLICKDPYLVGYNHYFAISTRQDDGMCYYHPQAYRRDINFYREVEQGQSLANALKKHTDQFIGFNLNHSDVKMNMLDVKQVDMTPEEFIDNFELKQNNLTLGYIIDDE